MKKLNDIVIAHAGPKHGNVWSRRYGVTTYDASNAVVLACWDEYHGEGKTTRTVHVLTDDIPDLIAALSARYVELRDQEKEKELKKTSSDSFLSDLNWFQNVMGASDMEEAG